MPHPLPSRLGKCGRGIAPPLQKDRGMTDRPPFIPKPSKYLPQGGGKKKPPLCKGRWQPERADGGIVQSPSHAGACQPPLHKGALDGATPCRDRRPDGPRRERRPRRSAETVGTGVPDGPRRERRPRRSAETVADGFSRLLAQARKDRSCTAAAAKTVHRLSLPAPQGAWRSVLIPGSKQDPGRGES